MTDEVRLFDSYTRGQSSVAAGGLLNEWSDVSFESFGVGLLADDVAETGDHLSLMVGQPVRVESARAKLRVPTGRTEDGQVVTEKETDDDASLIAGAFVRLNPDHDPDAKPDLGIGVRSRLSF